MLDICLLGTGGMMPMPRRWLTSMMARCDGVDLLIDCGEGTQIAMKEKGWSPKPIDIILFTHYCYQSSVSLLRNKSMLDRALP